jgi:hypothetical protein
MREVLPEALLVYVPQVLMVVLKWCSGSIYNINMPWIKSQVEWFRSRRFTLPALPDFLHWENLRSHFSFISLLRVAPSICVTLCQCCPLPGPETTLEIICCKEVALRSIASCCSCIAKNKISALSCEEQNEPLMDCCCIDLFCLFDCGRCGCSGSFSLPPGLSG